MAVRNKELAIHTATKIVLKSPSSGWGGVGMGRGTRSRTKTTEHHSGKFDNIHTHTYTHTHTKPPYIHKNISNTLELWWTENRNGKWRQKINYLILINFKSEER